MFVNSRYRKSFAREAVLWIICTKRHTDVWVISMGRDIMANLLPLVTHMLKLSY